MVACMEEEDDMRKGSLFDLPTKSPSASPPTSSLTARESPPVLVLASTSLLSSPSTARF